MKLKLLITSICVITVIFINLGGCIEKKSKQDNSLFPIDFVVFPVDTCAGEIIEFKDLSKIDNKSLANYTWYFGDGNVSYEQNPKYSYQRPGIYNVTLVVRYNDVVNKMSKYVVIRYKMPTAYFIYFLNKSEPNVITFVDKSIKGSTPIINWTWDFGDGSVAYGNISTHYYKSSILQDGVYVALKIRDANGWEDSISLPVYKNERMPILQIRDLKVNFEPVIPGRYIDVCACVVKNIGNKTTLFSIQLVDITNNRTLMQCCDILTPNEELYYEMRGKLPSNETSNNTTWHIGLRVWPSDEIPPTFDKANTQTMKSWTRPIRTI